MTPHQNYLPVLMVSLKRKLKQPSTVTFVCCGLVGVLGIVFIFVGIGGGFIKPTGYKLNCTATTAAKTSCVAVWDKHSANSRLYTNLCNCQRDYVVYQNGAPVGSATPTTPMTTRTIPLLEKGARFQWRTRNMYNRTENCGGLFPADEKAIDCYWYPLGDAVDNTTLYNYADKTDFQSSNGIFAIGMLMSFVAVVVNLYVLLVGVAPKLGCL